MFVVHYDIILVLIEPYGERNRYISFKPNALIKIQVPCHVYITALHSISLRKSGMSKFPDYAIGL